MYGFGFDPGGNYIDAQGATNTVLKVKRVSQTMFYTATHKVQMWAGKTFIAESDEVDMPPLDEDVRLWAMRMIGTHRIHLSWLGVDVKEEFKKFGGNVNDLYMY